MLGCSAALYAIPQCQSSPEADRRHESRLYVRLKRSIHRRAATRPCSVANLLKNPEGMAVRKALITGITGQDGSYLAELLLAKGYEVHGIIRRSSSFNTGRIDPIYEDPHVPTAQLHLVYGDLNDASSLNRIIRTIQPDEVYNLGAQSHVRVSFDIPEYTGEITGLGTIRLLEAIRESGLKPKFYQASSSEMFGKVLEIPQRETTPFYPRSPYGAAKVYAYWITVNYREAYNLFACNGILFNHESPRRGENFVTRKITRGVADPKYFRPTEVDLLIGDATKAQKTFGWKPKTTFASLVKLMVDADMAAL